MSIKFLRNGLNYVNICTRKRAVQTCKRMRFWRWNLPSNLFSNLRPGHNEETYLLRPDFPFPTEYSPPVEPRNNLNNDPPEYDSLNSLPTYGNVLRVELGLNEKDLDKRHFVVMNGTEELVHVCVTPCGKGFWYEPVYERL